MPANFAALDAFLGNLLDGVAEETADFLREELEGEGTGIHHPHLPNRSSSPQEYPAEQMGDLVRSIGWERTGPWTREVGSIHEPIPAHGFLLEVRPVSKGGRPWASRALVDPRLYARLRARVLTHV